MTSAVHALWYPSTPISTASSTMLHELLSAFPTTRVEGFAHLPSDARGALVIFHGQEESIKPQIAERLSRFTAMLDWVIFISLGDEGCDFPYDLLEHRNRKLWIQTPKPGRAHFDRAFIEGYPPDIHAYIAATAATPARDLDWYFAGQITHERRRECADALLNLHDLRGYILPTGGFCQGVNHATYYAFLSRAKIAPCPAGPLSPDTFRFAEALECGAIPILDAFSPDRIRGYWDLVLGPHPFHVVEDWSTVREVMGDILRNYEYESRMVQYWWKKYKLAMRSNWLAQDLIALGAV